MKKLLLLVVLVLFMGGCHTCYTEPEPTVDEPLIGPQLKLTDQNDVEKLLTGEWIGSTDSRNKVIYKFSDNLGKQELTYDKLGNLVTCISYEIREKFFTDATTSTTTHLLVGYGSSENVEWDKQPIYYEISEIDNDQYTMYTRMYKSADKNEDFYMKDPTKTVRLSINGAGIPLNYQRVK